MDKRPVTLIYDPIMFKGGSKVATSDALAQCNPQTQRFIVLTADKQYWQKSEFHQLHDAKICSLPLCKWTSQHHNGLLYWFEQLIATVVVLFFMVRFYQTSQLLGASGPGIDMPLYLVKKLTGKRVIQWVHGNVGLSRSIGYCLVNADAVFFLPSTKRSIQNAIEQYFWSSLNTGDVGALSELFIQSENYFETVNGITESRWPTPCQRDIPVGFWAASLLKWKGVDTLIDAVKLAHTLHPLPFNICYIQPQNTNMPVSNAPVELPHTQWHQDPIGLDEIRRQSNIFVSTSHNEPFGLSILEALAAGMCVLIPSDNAYWDQVLTHNENCVKYQPNDVDSLCDALLYVFNDKQAMQRCCQNGLDIAQQYKASVRYDTFARYLCRHSATVEQHA
ncbi:glycosyltransferase family 4 protein [Vibrio sinaloensis]|uniref:glycosyltransferase family 4 protein n=1 Tax=Photobacterium sp. (strain ATCC 43367) TaxID=379097 RepID=UPI00057E6684|nr:glycosyltransferase family 4 protein [Vibrio sinaloensis]KHT38763.1 glycosyl transferase [Vibrio sinaloensis]